MPSDLGRQVPLCGRHESRNPAVLPATLCLTARRDRAEQLEGSLVIENFFKDRLSSGHFITSGAHGRRSGLSPLRDPQPWRGDADLSSYGAGDLDASPALDETDLCRNYYIPGLATGLEVTVRTKPALHPLEQRLSIDWLGDVVVDARGDALLPVLTHRSGGDGDDGKVG